MKNAENRKVMRNLRIRVLLFYRITSIIRKYVDLISTYEQSP